MNAAGKFFACIWHRQWAAVAAYIATLYVRNDTGLGLNINRPYLYRELNFALFAAVSLPKARETRPAISQGIRAINLASTRHPNVSCGLELIGRSALTASAKEFPRFDGKQIASGSYVIGGMDARKVALFTRTQLNFTLPSLLCLEGRSRISQ